MRKRLTNNIGWKILSLSLAILLWLVVVNIEDPRTTKEIRDIEVEIMNMHKIEEKNKEATIDKKTVTVKVAGKRSVIESLKTNDIKAEADIQDLTLADSVPIKVSAVKDIEIISQEPYSLTVKIEDIKTEQKRVTPIIEEEPKLPYVVNDVDIELEPVILQVTGPESQINRISNVQVELDIKPETIQSTQDIVLSNRPIIIDESGKEIKGLTLNTNTIKAVVKVKKRKEIPVRVELKGEIPEGYKLTKTVNLADEKKIIIEGKEEVLKTMNELVLPIELGGLTKAHSETFKISSYLPEGLEVVNRPSDIINVTLPIEALQQKVITVPISEIDVRNIPSNTQFKFLSEEDMNLTLEGLASHLDGITVESLNCRINLKDLDVGKHNIPVELYVPWNTELIGQPPLIEIELTGSEVKVEEEEE